MGDPHNCSISTDLPACLIGQWMTTHSTDVQQAVTTFADAIADTVTNAGASLRSLVGGWSSTLRRVPYGTQSTLSNTLATMTHAVEQHARVAVEAIQRSITKFVGEMRAIETTVASVTPCDPVFVFDTPTAPDVTHQLPSTPFKSLTVRHDTGIVHVIGTARESMHVRAYYREHSPTCQTTVTTEGKTLVVKTDNAFLDPGPCNVDVAILVPAGIAVTADVRKGTLHLTDLAGPLALKVGIGTLWGEIRSSNIDVRTGLGELFLRWTQLPSVGAVDIRAGATDTTLEFPEGSVVAPTVESGLSDVDIGVATNPAAAFKVRVRTGLADLHIRYSH